MNEVISDPLDLASQQEQVQTDMAIKHIQAQADKLEVEPDDKCLFCGAKFEKGSKRRWCNADHRDMWVDFGSE